MTGGYDYFYTLQEICVLLNLLPNTFRQIAREYEDLIVVREQVRKGRKVMGLPRAEFEIFRTIVEMRARGSSGEEIRGHLGVALRPQRRDETTHSGARPVEEAPPALESGPSPGPEPRMETAVAAETGPFSDGDDPPSAWSDAAPAEDDNDDFSFVDEAEPAGAGGLPDDPPASALAATTLEAALAGRLDPDHPALMVERALLVEIAELKDEVRRMDERRRDERDKLLTVLMRTQHELQSLRYEVGASLSRRDRKKKRGFWAWLFDL